MNSEIANANPTILDRADLPKRRTDPNTRPSSSSHSILFTNLLPSTTVLDPFSEPPSLTHSPATSDDEDDDTPEPIDAQEIYDLVSTMCDPEHPVSLGELAVVRLEHITVHDPPGAKWSRVQLEFTPTITHCHLATVIGLGLVVRLRECLPPRFRIDVKCREGTHQTEGQLNKQLADKERVLCALENETLLGVLGKMMETCV